MASVRGGRLLERVSAAAYPLSPAVQVGIAGEIGWQFMLRQYSDLYTLPQK